MLLLTLRGTPTIYYGDEIGLENVPIAPAQVQDPFEKNVPGLGLGRDGFRTPMQWDATQNAGFSLGSPWLPQSEDFESRNVSSLRQDHASIFNLHCRLLVIRRQRLSLSVGTYEPIAATGDLLVFIRKHHDERTFVALNLGTQPLAVCFSAQHIHGQILVSTLGDRECEIFNGDVDLRPNEGIMSALE
jgi:alpha-glucosidase